VVEIDSRLYAREIIDAAKESARLAVEAYHRSQPLEPGMPRGLLRAEIRPPTVADAVQELLSAEGALVIEKETVRLPQFVANLSETQEPKADALRAALRDAGSEGRRVAELVTITPNAREIAEFLTRVGEARRIGADRYYDATALEDLKNSIIGEIENVGGVATPAQLREKTGLSRKFLIPVLEWLDAAGFTVRVGNGRSLGPKA
jgi:selenocysteine-specific elongation factor